MSWTHLSTLDQLKRNLPMVKTSHLSDEILDDNIADADERVYDDLSKTVDWDQIEALDTVPRILSRLAQAQTCILTIVRCYHSDDAAIGSGEGTEENSFLKYWHDEYKKILQQITDGEVLILDNDNEDLQENMTRPRGLGRII